MPTGTPARRKASRSAIPEPSFRFELGQWTTLKRLSRQHALIGEEFDLVPSALQIAHGERLVPLLEGVGMNGPAAAQGQIAGAHPKGVGAGEDESGIEHVAQPALRSVLESIAQRLGRGERRVGVQAHGGWQVVAAVHEALAGEGAQPGFGDGFQQARGTRADADVLNRGGAAEKAFGGAEEAAPVGALVVVSGLQRPDALAQPRQQAAPLGQPAEERLPQMKMPLDQPRKDQAAGDVHHPRTRRHLGRAERGDAPVANEQVRPRQHGRAGVQGEEGASPQEDGGRRGWLSAIGLHEVD
jgi:hypothetical protein